MANNYITKVYLLNVPLENDYKNTLYFTSKEKQQQYFESKIIKSYTNFSYQRKDDFIRIPEHFDKLQNVNYVMYQNSAFSNKWFYAFVTDIKYIDDGRTDLIIETDYLQTWLFDYTVKASFVEREHVSDDTIGNHILDEGLETGDYICNKHTIDSHMDEILNDLCYIFALTTKTILEGEKFETVSGDVYNGIYSGVKYYRYDSASAVELITDLFDRQPEAITGLFMAPKFLAPLDTEQLERVVKSSTSAQSYEMQLDKNYGLQNYSPRNNKLKVFPYCYMLASNNQGNSAIYKYEDFGASKCEFIIKGALTPGCSIRMTPQNFKGIALNDEESLNLGKFPICNFVNDMYTNWLTQNSINIAGKQITSDQINIATSTISGVLQTVAGIGMMATGGGALAGAGMIANGLTSGFTGVTNAVMQQKQHEMIPPQASGNLNCGDVITASNRNNFHFYNMSIKQQYAKIIDGYFDMYGYRVNRVKVPNKAHRSRWWFTKTIDVNIDGAIPNKDMQVIKNCYNNGITFWRNADEIQNYALSNAIAITDGAVTE